MLFLLSYLRCPFFRYTLDLVECLKNRVENTTGVQCSQIPLKSITRQLRSMVEMLTGKSISECKFKLLYKVSVIITRSLKFLNIVSISNFQDLMRKNNDYHISLPSVHDIHYVITRNHFQNNSTVAIFLLI